MKKLIVLFVLNSFVCLKMNAQTEIHLEFAIRIYNSLNAAGNPVLSENEEYLDKIEEGDRHLRQVIQEGSETEKKSARYFLTLITQKRIDYLKVSEDQNLLEIKKTMLGLFEEFDALNEAQFPLYYVFEGKNFVLSYEGFEETRKKYFTQINHLYCTDRN